MSNLQPLYTAKNCQWCGTPRWGLSIFWRQEIEGDDWLGDLKSACNSDGIEIESHRLARPDISQFLASAEMIVSPQVIVQRVKGRLQYLVRNQYLKPFKRNFAIRSVGHVTRKIVEQYVASQLNHHQMADPHVHERLLKYQFADPAVDLSRQQFTSHGLYWYVLHIVIVHRERLVQVDPAVLGKVRETILVICRAKQYRLSRAGILADHIHLALGCPFGASPAEVALAFLNNLAYAQGMKTVYQYGAYLGTVGEYDLGAIDNNRVVERD